MQEEVTNKTVAIAIKAAKFNINIFIKLIKMYLNHRKIQKGGNFKGKKMSVKKLSQKYDGLKTAELEEEKEIKSFEKIAKKYNLEYALKKDKTTKPPTYVVFFKGKDVDTIDHALNEFTKLKAKSKDKPSLLEKMKEFKEMANKMNIGKDKHKSKEQSL